MRITHAFLTFVATKDKKPESASEKKDYSLEVPMIDLATVIAFVKRIRDEAMETASLGEVAEKFDYAASTSTPFYRRLVASRLFGLLEKSTARLTPRATAYLKPDDENSQSNALIEAVRGVPVYAETIQKLNGRKPNVDLISNGFETKLKITMPAAMVCAKVFEQSLRTAGMLSTDGMVNSANLAPPPKPLDIEDQENREREPDPIKGGKQPQMQTQTLYLNNGRKITVNAPLDLKTAELTRINQWLKYTLIVNDEDLTSPKGTTS